MPFLTALLAGLAAAALLSPELASLLEDRPKPAEVWRPFTGHWAHHSAAHFLLNLAVFAPFAVRRERRVGSRRLATELAVLALATACGVRLLHPDWESYRGLSGVTYGLVVLELLAPGRSAHSAICAGVLVWKSFAEVMAGGWLLGAGDLEATLGLRFLPGSHAGGAVAALGLFLLTARVPRFGNARTAPSVPRL